MKPTQKDEAAYVITSAFSCSCNLFKLYIMHG